MYRLVTPPAHLLDETPIPTWEGGDWAGVIDLARSRQAALIQCNADKASVMDYIEQAEEAYRGE